MTDAVDRLWQSMTTADVPAFAGRDPVVVLPLAAVEQHGPHLPLSTDVDIALGILDCSLASLPPDFPVGVLPVQPIGASLEHVRFPGTLSLNAELLVRLIVAHGEAVARCGVRRLVLFNSHGGNRHVLEEAGLRLRHETGLLVVLASYFDFPRPAEPDLPEAEWRQGLHGGAVETAMMLHLKPELVRASEIAPRPSIAAKLEGTLRHLGPDTSVPFAWTAGDLHPSGAVGDASLASPGLGRRLVEHYGRVLAEVIRDARAFPLEQLA